jgi:RNA ligase
MSQFDREHLQALVAEGWLSTKRHPDADLWIYNYTKRTQYEKHWTAETLVCRGLILNEAGDVVARAFPKFFNYGAPEVESLPAEPYRVTEKLDGSLGILYYLDGSPCIATRGNFVSEQAIEATAMIREQEIERVEGVTPLFEIVYPANKIVVDYGDRRDLTLLAAICNETGVDKPLPRYSGPIVQHHGQVDIDGLAAEEEPNREGFVVAFASGLRVKVKFAEYLRLHRIITGVSARQIWESMRDGDDLDGLLVDLPDEIHRWISDTRAGLQAAYDDELSRASSVFERRPADADRKTIAEYFARSDANLAVLFRMLDGKNFDDLIWKAIRPEASTLGEADRTSAPREIDCAASAP